MALAVFNQFPQLTRFFAQLARAAAHKETARRFVRLDLSTGRATLVDHAALNGAAVSFALPDLVPGESRRFDLRRISCLHQGTSE